MKKFLSYLILSIFTTFANSAKAQTETTIVCKVQAPSSKIELVVEITFPGEKITEAFDGAVTSKSVLGAKVNIINFREGNLPLSVNYFGFEPDMFKAVGATQFGVFELTYDFWSAQKLVLEYKVDADIYQGACKLK